MNIFAHHTVLHSIEMNTQQVLGLGLAVLMIAIILVWRREK